MSSLGKYEKPARPERSTTTGREANIVVQIHAKISI